MKRIILACGLAIILMANAVSVMAEEERQVLLFSIGFDPKHPCSNGYDKLLTDQPQFQYPGNDWDCYLAGGISVGEEFNKRVRKGCSADEQAKMVFKERIPAAKKYLRSLSWPVDKLKVNGSILPGSSTVEVKCFKRMRIKKSASMVSLPVFKVRKILDPGAEPYFKDEKGHQGRAIRVLYQPKDPSPLPLLFTLGGEVLYTHWGMKKDAIEDVDIDDHKEVGRNTVVGSPFVGLGWEFPDFFAFMARGRYIYITQSPKTRHNGWGAEGVFLFGAFLKRMEIEVGGFYYWLSVVSHRYETLTGEKTQLESATYLAGGLGGLNWRLTQKGNWRGWRLRLPTINCGKQIGTGIWRWGVGAGIEYRF